VKSIEVWCCESMLFSTSLIREPWESDAEIDRKVREINARLAERASEPDLESLHPLHPRRVRLAGSKAGKVF